MKFQSSLTLSIISNIHYQSDLLINFIGNGIVVYPTSKKINCSKKLQTKFSAISSLHYIAVAISCVLEKLSLHCSNHSNFYDWNTSLIAILQGSQFTPYISIVIF